MSSSIGIDSGTFHTVAVAFGCAHVIPTRSIPSIALRGPKAYIVGADAIPQMNLGLDLVLAPKLLIGKSDRDDPAPKEIIRKLISQALKDLGHHADKFVLTVPPSWTLEHCQVLEGALASDGLSVSFIHEPIALLVSAMYLAPFLRNEPRVSAMLQSPSTVLVCDWGAGTVDLSVVRVSEDDGQFRYSCIDELTDIEHGGTTMARDIIRKENGLVDQGTEDRDAFRLQRYWQGDRLAGVDFSRYQGQISERRLMAADAIGQKIKSLLASLSESERKNLIVLLHGGPLESEEVRTYLSSSLNTHCGIRKEALIHIGEAFAEKIEIPNVKWRRDVLVAAGAALFAERGKTLPEFEYAIGLTDSFGQCSSWIRLAKGANLEGKQVITPPFTGVDYTVRIKQMKRDKETAISKELRLFVRPGAVVLYQIREAGVGYALLEASEAKNLPVPVLFEDSRVDCVKLPERSTHFLINLT